MDADTLGQILQEEGIEDESVRMEIAQYIFDEPDIDEDLLRQFLRMGGKESLEQLAAHEGGLRTVHENLILPIRMKMREEYKPD